jgi:hypothetical protein
VPEEFVQVATPAGEELTLPPGDTVTPKVFWFDALNPKVTTLLLVIVRVHVAFEPALLQSPPQPEKTKPDKLVAVKITVELFAYTPEQIPSSPVPFVFVHAVIPLAVPPTVALIEPPPSVTVLADIV